MGWSGRERLDGQEGEWQEGGSVPPYLPFLPYPALPCIIPVAC